jgi:hypothetical protein
MVRAVSENDSRASQDSAMIQNEEVAKVLDEVADMLVFSASL